VTIRIVVGEDNLLAREGICRVLEAEDDIEIVAACGDLNTLRDAVSQQQPDVVLADIQMPPTKTDEGIRFAAELRTTHPCVGVVILSQYAEPVYATELLEGGSDRRAYLLKERVLDRGDVSRAVREVAEGRSVVDARIVDLLVTAKRQRANGTFDELTAREQEILGMVAQGWSNAGIADKLGITTRAVERHTHSIFSKLDLGDSGYVSRRVKAALLFLAGQVG
jgi:DNA-binding NarL/FixJ family response regulator